MAPPAHRSGGRRSRKRGRDGSRLVRDRIRTSALDRLRDHADVGGRHHCTGSRTHVRHLRRNLCRARAHHGSTAARAGGSLAPIRSVMGEPELVAAILWLSLTAYAVLAGADFGGGVWDLFAAGPRPGAQRAAVAQAMGPVWEANHVCLIF